MNRVRSSISNFTIEFLGRVILIAVAVMVESKAWWAPLVAVPIIWQIWDGFFGQCSRIYSPGLKLLADGLTHLIWLSYIGYAIVAMGGHVGHWYGWGLGVVVGLGVAHILGLLWPHRWHLEFIEKRI